ncbi:HNH endonuclease family protein [Enterovibrio norvegicus]|uniref:HNH endonuclease family protein n=1 Tax=Enterovibrio norvegicus TaxID=188144 RepID=UPI000C862D3B|nr:HNH endonuclease family protein [Enterovibrio norvegicus]PMH64513.1 hypothetical protein BCU62_15780 [Enterovibrio norvegicus]
MKIFTFLLSLTALNLYAAELVVKKSKNGICHDTQSSSYSRTKQFTAFDTLEACLNSGGRTPLDKSAKESSGQYSRKEFGSGWADLDKDCQNSRAEQLIKFSSSQVRFKTDRGCSVVSGRWISSFTGETIYQAADIDIDHVVPLRWAWERGADLWNKEQRIQFANDPANLLAVELSLNRQKGAKGLNEWLPPKNQCQYILRFIRVKKQYQIELKPSETQQYNALKSEYCG